MKEGKGKVARHKQYRSQSCDAVRKDLQLGFLFASLVAILLLTSFVQAVSFDPRLT